MEVVLIIYGISMCIAFLLGASVRVEKTEKKKVTLNPIKIIEQKKIEKEIKKEIDKQDEIIKAIEFNIDNYNGTAMGQKQIPS